MSKFNTTVAVLSGAAGIYSVVSESLFVFGIVCVGLVFVHILVWALKPKLLGSEYNQSAPFFVGVFGTLAIAAFALLTLPGMLAPDSMSVEAPPQKSISSDAATKYQEEDFSDSRIEKTLGATLKPSSVQNPRTGASDKGLLVSNVAVGGLLHNVGIRNGDLISEIASNDAASINSAATSLKNAVVLGSGPIDFRPSA